MYVNSAPEAWSLLLVGIGLWALIGTLTHWTSLKEQAAERADAFEAKVRSALPGTAGGAGYGDILADLGSRTAGFAFAYGLGLGFSAGAETLRGVGRLGRRMAGASSAPDAGTSAPGAHAGPDPASGTGPGANPGFGGAPGGPGASAPGGDSRSDEAWWGGFFSWLGFFSRAGRPGAPASDPAPDLHIELDDPTPYEGEILDDPAAPGRRTAAAPDIDDAEIVPDVPGQGDAPAPGAFGPFIPGPRTSLTPEGILTMSALASAVARTLNELLASAKRALNWARGASEQADQIANIAAVRARSGAVRSTAVMGYSSEAVAESARWSANAQAAAVQKVDAASVAAVGNCVATAGAVAARAQRIAQLSQVAADAEAAVEAEAHLLAADCVSHAHAAAIAHQTLTALHTLHQHAHDTTGIAAADRQFYGQA